MSLSHYEVECSNCGSIMLGLDNCCSHCGAMLESEVNTKPFYEDDICTAFSYECDAEDIVCNECDTMKSYVKGCNS